METKAIIISINPKWVAKILNGEKTIEVRKHFPKDYKGWVYIYCTKDVKDYLIYYDFVDISFDTTIGERESGYFIGDKRFVNEDCNNETHFNLNGKVVARFYCDKVWPMGDFTTGCWDYSKSIEENHKTWSHHYELGYVSHKYLHKYQPFLDNDPNTYSQEYGSMLIGESCLSQEEIYNYLNNNKLCMYGKKGYAVHISQLEIFDKPKDISEFKRCTAKTCIYGKCHKYMHCLKSLTKAPQSWCYVVSC